MRHSQFEFPTEVLPAGAVLVREDGKNHPLRCRPLHAQAARRSSSNWIEDEMHHQFPISRPLRDNAFKSFDVELVEQGMER
jgi:hypothetical protein